MNLSEGQETGLAKILDWTKNEEQEFFLGGYAGTGKTTLLAMLTDALSGFKIKFATPTGKAANVLSSKIKKRVVTLHRLLFIPNSPSLARLTALVAAFNQETDEEEKAKLTTQIKKAKKELAGEQLSFSDNENLEVADSTIAIVDEASMVPSFIRKKLKEKFKKILWVGDHGQLSPVMSQSWFRQVEKDHKLEKVLRQSLDNPIIRMSMEIRAGTCRPSNWRDNPHAMITDKKRLNGDFSCFMEANQLIAGYNNTRQRLNKWIRKQIGFTSELPQIGDKLVCLKNDYKHQPALINGEICRCVEHVKLMDLGTTNKFGGLQDYFTNITVDYNDETFNCSFYAWHTASHYKDIEEEPRQTRVGWQEFDYAYCLTAHKAQGSEWPFVLVVDDGFMKKNKAERKRWLYTAVTRAKEKLILVQT